MTAVATRTSDVSAAAPRDLRRATRWFLALIMPVGPVAVALLRFQLPYFTADGGGADVAASVLANPQAQSLVVWLAFVATLTLVPAVFAIGRLTRRRTPRLTAAALLLAVPGYLMMGWLAASDKLLWAGAQVGVEAETLGRLYEATHPASAVAITLFVVGHVIGTILLGVAMWRSNAVPTWAAVLTIVSQPLHFVAAVIVGSPMLDLVAWGMTALGFAVAAAAVVRLDDQAWDLPPDTVTVKPLR
jgi:hypothetical protein